MRLPYGEGSYQVKGGDSYSQSKKIRNQQISRIPSDVRKVPEPDAKNRCHQEESHNQESWAFLWVKNRTSTHSTQQYKDTRTKGWAGGSFQYAALPQT